MSKRTSDWLEFLIFALLIFSLAAMGISERNQRHRVDELWKEYDTHVRYCPCLKREWPVVEPK